MVIGIVLTGEREKQVFCIVIIFVVFQTCILVYCPLFLYRIHHVCNCKQLTSAQDVDIKLKATWSYLIPFKAHLHINPSVVYIAGKILPVQQLFS